MKTRLLATLLFAFFLCSCVPSQKIAYNTGNIQRYSRPTNISISVQPFEDIRSQSEINLTHLQAKGVNKKINENNSCINAEKLYKIPVGTQMADIFAAHLSKKTFFSNVLLNQKENTDYYVTAKVKHFYGAQKFSTKAVIGANFGLIGALATADLKTQGTIIIELSDVCLYNKEDKLVAKVGDFKKEYTGEFPVDAHCYCIYQNINQKLMEFNEELSYALFVEAVKTQEKKM